MIHVNSSAEPFFFTGNDTALLFIHGFTASPSEVYPTARLIHYNSGITVSSILLPGHGSHPRFLNRTTWQDWYKAVADEVGFLLNNYSKVYVAGLSLGGLLAMQLGLNYPDIKGIIAINPPIKLYAPVKNKLAYFTHWIKPYHYKDEKEQEVLRKQGRFAYEVIPLKAFLSLQELRKKVLQNIDELNIPLLLIQALNDETVNPAGAKIVSSKANKGIVELIELEDSGHIATMGKNERVISDMIINFIGKN